VPATRRLLESTVRHLASFERESATDGERDAAEWLAACLNSLGARARIEEEQATGGYWWSLGTMSAASAAAGFLAARKKAGWPSRLLAAAVAGTATAGIIDELDSNRHWFRKRFLPHRSTWNVVAEAGDPDAEETLVVHAHHDAAHGGLVFHPEIPYRLATRFPSLIDRSDTSPPLMWPVIGSSAMVAAGAALGKRKLLKAGVLSSAVSAAAFAEIGAHDVVPGANDNLTGVAVLVALAASLRERPIRGLRVILLSTGSEESLLEGMRAFGERHFPNLPPDRTRFVCLDTVGAHELIMLEGEGMVRIRSYPEVFKRLVADTARSARVGLRRGMRFRNATDGLIPLKAGYETVTICSMDAHKQPGNYHTASDIPQHVEFDTVKDAVDLVDALVRRMADDWEAPPIPKVASPAAAAKAAATPVPAAS
jgi:hypothetical protein